MAYPSNFIRLTWIYSVAGSDEIAETGLHVCTIGSPFDAVAFLTALTADDPGAALCGEMLDAYNAQSSLRWGSYSSLVGFKAAALDTTGSYLTDPYVYDEPAPATGSDANVPPQDSVVVSLRSGLTFGTANYGRMYLPHTLGDLATGTPFIQTAAATDMAASFAGLVTAVNTLADDWTATAGVMNISSVGSGSKKPVAQVGIGNVVDTQRRRRNRLPEAYVFDTP